MSSEKDDKGKFQRGTKENLASCADCHRRAVGDFIFGDNDGVQLIPERFVDEVLLRVEDIFNKENEERELIAGGMAIDEVYRVYGVL